MTRHEYQLWGAKATAVRGEDLPHSKLDAQMVRVIRMNRRGLTAKQWGSLLGLHYRTIEKVRARESWAHVE